MSSEREITPVAAESVLKPGGGSPADAGVEGSATTVTQELASMKINGVGAAPEGDTAQGGEGGGKEHAGAESAPASKEASVEKAATEGDGGEGDEAEDGSLEPQPKRGGNDDSPHLSKIFVGGIAFDVTNEDLSAHFAQFGEIISVQVKYDRTTGRSRGFAFVEFASTESCRAALDQKEQMIKNKLCEIKPAKSRETAFQNKKVFVGGLPSDFPEEELRSHFEQYGTVEEIEWPYDKLSKVHRNYAFIVFEDEAGADRAAADPKQTFGSREADVKKAVPQSKRNSYNYMRAGLGMGAGGSYGMFAPNRTPTTYLGTYRGYGGAPATALQSAAQWFHNALGMPSNGWAATAAAMQAMQQGPYGAAAAGAPPHHHGNGTSAAGGHGAGWSDSSIWYGNAMANAAAAAANHFYAQGVGGPPSSNPAASGYGAAVGGYGNNGYDYGGATTGGSMSGLLGRHPSGVSNAHHHHHQPAAAAAAHYASHGQNGNGSNGAGQRYGQQPTAPSQPPQF